MTSLHPEDFQVGHHTPIPMELNPELRTFKLGGDRNFTDKELQVLKKFVKWFDDIPSDNTISFVKASKDPGGNIKFVL